MLFESHVPCGTCVVAFVDCDGTGVGVGVGVGTGVGVAGAATPRYIIATTTPFALSVYTVAGSPDVLMLAVYVPSLPTVCGCEALTDMVTEDGEPLAIPDTPMLYVAAGTLLEYEPTWLLVSTPQDTE